MSTPTLEHPMSTAHPTLEDAKEVARAWYSPRAVGMVELATCTTHQRPLSDEGLLHLIEEVAAESREAARLAFTTAADMEALDTLERWARTEADLRGLT